MLLLYVIMIFLVIACTLEGTARLTISTNSEFPTSGRIDIYFNGDWGNNICFDDYFTASEANLLCQQLGFARAYLIGKANQFRYRFLVHIATAALKEGGSRLMREEREEGYLVR